VIIPDVNLLLYASITSFQEHAAARAWFTSILNGEDQLLLPAISLFGFVRIASNPRIFDSPIPVSEALASVESWLSLPHVHFLSPGPRFIEISFDLLRQLGAARNLTTDVQLAAHAMENQATLYSHDTDFARISGLRWVDPL
jgi:toxin-antitoxin system PIN domain toxin